MSKKRASEEQAGALATQATWLMPWNPSTERQDAGSVRLAWAMQRTPDLPTQNKQAEGT